MPQGEALAGRDSVAVNTEVVVGGKIEGKFHFDLELR
jgi:hypothetical protein